MPAHTIRYHCNYAMGKYKVQGVCACVHACVCGFLYYKTDEYLDNEVRPSNSDACL